VYDYVSTKIDQDLPGHATAPGDGAPAAPLATQLVAALQVLVGARAPTGDAVPNEPKSIAESYRETYKVMLRYCNVAGVEEVAPLWRRMANAHKSELMAILNQELNKVCMARGLSTDTYTPVVTSQLKQMITSFEFLGLGPDDLTTGCQPFLVAYAGDVHHHQVQAAAMIGNQLAQGEQNPTLADYRALLESEKLKPPRDILGEQYSATFCSPGAMPIPRSGRGTPFGGVPLESRLQLSEPGRPNHGAQPSDPPAKPGPGTNILCPNPLPR
jgi:hypothetical protein